MTSPTNDFTGFPGIGKATAIPNLFFSAVLPRLESPDALLAFLWVTRLAQAQRGEARCASAAVIWAEPAARASFEAFGGGKAGLDSGLARCLELRALIAIRLRGAGVDEAVYFPNDPVSRRTVTRVRSGELSLRPETTVVPLELPEQRPGIFRLYEEHIGTITPMVGDRLVEAEDLYPAEWIEDAFREAAELNARNWRYIEKILRNWAEEGRPNETPGRDSLEDRKRRYLGGALRPGN
ncbi:MAG: DnaD domain protein [Dehalococcoidia bacterium]|jgi:DNA replication protein|nr:DnaD domain protein [Dehalococcoidia bacterium]